uniref:Uncharacterized protein n=1 Tax=Leptospirillum sp. Group II '5-way CG' TaxID=419541 RepID=B6ALG9_9BACT|nr:MAG: Hypothetical protein CGL2_09314001 [Leptospirillum sp. Group II '5-way CG']
MISCMRPQAGFLRRVLIRWRSEPSRDTRHFRCWQGNSSEGRGSGGEVEVIARLFVHLPFFLTIPEGEQFSVFEYEDSGIKVRVFPPLRSEKAPAIDVDQQIKIDGIPTSQADTLRIDFDKESFQRGKDDPCDPNESIIGRAINSFLIRLRHVARSPKVRMLNFPQVTWRLQYLNSDESEIEKDERLIRGRFARRASLSWIAVTKEVWNNIYSLPIDYERDIVKCCV